MFDLSGKTALVTGATGGIGGAIACALHQQGATVALSGTRADALDALAHGGLDLGVRGVARMPERLREGEHAEAQVVDAWQPGDVGRDGQRDVGLELHLHALGLGGLRRAYRGVRSGGEA